MGCDIHMFAELLNPDGGTWTDLGAVPVDAGYWFFSRLAGVRAADEDPEPIAAFHGLPDSPHIAPGTRDFDPHWRSLGWDDGWLGDHSHSWCWLSEILEYEWDDLPWGPTRPCVVEMFQHLIDAGYDPRYVRVVFGFDS